MSDIYRVSNDNTSLHRRGVLFVGIGVAALFFFGLLLFIGRDVLSNSNQKEKATEDMLKALRDVHSQRLSGAGSNYTAAPLVADALRRGADPNARYGVTPGSPEAAYFWANRRLGRQVNQDTTLEARQHLPALMMAVSQEDVEAMRVLLKAGANRIYTPIRPGSGPNGPNPGPSGCQDIVSLATGSRSPEMVRFALSLGGDPNRYDQWGTVPLESTLGSPEVTRLLLDHGANPFIQVQGMPLLTWVNQMYGTHHSRWTPERQARFLKSLSMIKAAASRKETRAAVH